MLDIVLKHYLLGIISLFGFYLIGNVILNSIKSNIINKYKGNFFYELLLGLLISIMFYALIISKGKTVLILLIPLFGFIVFKMKIKISKLKSVINRECLKFIFFSYSVIFLYQLLFVFDFTNGNLKPFFVDYYSYGSYANNLKEFGVENIHYSLNYFFEVSYKGLLPYHYFDLWSTSFYTSCINGSSVTTYYLNSVSIFISIYYIGLYSFMRYKNISKIKAIIIAFILLFVTTIFDPSNNNFGFNFYPFLTDSSLMGAENQKNAIVFIMFLLALQFYMKQNYFFFKVVLISIPIFSTSFLPGIWGGILLYEFFKLFYFRFKPKKIDWRSCVFVFFLFFLFFGFYKIFGDPPKKSLLSIMDIPLLQRLPKDFDKGVNFVTVKSFIANFIFYSLPSITGYAFNMLKLLWLGFCFFLPFLLVLKDEVKKYKNIFFFLSSSFLVGNFAVVFTDGLIDHAQLLSNLTVLFCVLICVLTIDLFSGEYGKWRQITLVFFLLIFNVLPTMSNKFNSKLPEENITFIDKINNQINKSNIKSKVILIYLSSKDFHKKIYHWWLGANDLYILSQKYENNYIYTLGNPEVYLLENKLSSADSINYTYYTPVNVFKSSESKNKMINFINHYHIKYIYLKADVEIPDYIQKRKHEVIYSNLNTSKFIILK